MGVLAPLYLAGLAALSLPLIFHLVRRTPRGRQVFSSLMFLLPSPPRLTRRSRLDQIILLLMRLAALALLAFAFSRPFLREAATLAIDDLAARRVAILVDGSASMRRGDLWRQALAQVDKELADLGPHDEVALFTFGDELSTEVGFDASPASSDTSRAEIVRQAAKKLRPTWQGTDLGGALVAIASELDASRDLKQSAAEQQIIVISDFAKGTKLDALQSFEWPKKPVHVVLRRLVVGRTTNAFAQLLTADEESSAGDLRVRVVNSADSKDDQFFVAWTNAAAKTPSADETAVYVPPGQSRVVKLPRPDDKLQADRIVLRGDDHDFDNAYFVVPPRKQQVKLLYAGDDPPDDQQGPLFYLKLATTGDPLRQVEVQPLDKDDASKLDGRPQLVIATRKLSSAFAEPLKTYVERGGTLVLAPQDQESAAIVPLILDDVDLSAPTTGGGDFLLLGEIDFTHPLFASFANPRYSDFTKIHFWKHRSLVLKNALAARVIAKFDNGEPALLERTLGQGRVVVFASGWHPEDSQLALSTKFVPLIGALLDQACGTTEALAGVSVGQAVEISSTESAPSLIVHKPDGTEARLASNESPRTTHRSHSFAQTDQPGIYDIAGGADAQRFAVNLAAMESNTAPLELEQLEQLGVKTGAALSRQERLERIRQERDTELEGRQKFWRWLLVGALGVLVLETFWAGRAARQITKAELLA
jgi:aerotolerance regulator-like protein/VWA domain-containing protein